MPGLLLLQREQAEHEGYPVFFMGERFRRLKR